MKFDWIVSSHGRFGSGTALIRSVGKTSKSEKFESTGQCCQGETGQHSSFSSEDLEVSPGCRQRLLPDIRQRFSTACHSVSPWRPALKGWTADHGDEMRIVRWCPVRQERQGAPTETAACPQASVDDVRRRTARRAR